MKVSLKVVLLTLALAALLVPAMAQAQASATDTGSISVTIQSQIITLTNNTPLAFGTITPFGRSGTATVPATGPETGSNLFINSAGSSASWSVTGTPNAFYGITLPGSPVVVSSGTNTMNVDTFTHSAGAQPFLKNTGTDTFNVGATLHVGANQPAGIYTGTYSVTVAYN